MTTDPHQVDTTDIDDQTASSADRSTELSVMYTIGLVGGLVISGFALYRWQTDDRSGAAINALIVAIIALSMLLGRSRQYRDLSLKLFGLTTTIAAILSSEFVSSNGLLWAMLVLVINTLILSRRWAIYLNLSVIVVLTASTHLYQSVLQQVSWTTVAILITTFSQISMEQLRQQRKLLAKQANADPLTGAGNRRLMTQHLQEIASSRRSGESNATLMVLDLDNFKAVNDVHGHEVGDRVLLEFAQSAHSSMRAADGFYRMGGEEFVMLLRGMDETTARGYLPKLHQRLSRQVSTSSGPVEFSAGAAAMRMGETWSQWLARADKALYIAKENGRNRLAFDED